MYHKAKRINVLYCIYDECDVLLALSFDIMWDVDQWDAE